MFGFLDGDTPETARRLFGRAADVQKSYLHLHLHELTERISSDIPEEMRFISHDGAGFTYADLPEFSFRIMMMLDEPILSIFAGGRYDGFMLQWSAGSRSWHTSIKKPIARRLGPKASRLSQCFYKQFEVRNLDETMAAIRGRFR